MKKYFIILAFALTSFICKAQSNLQLNQVLTYNGAVGLGPGFNNQYGPIWTVPNGKVWKVEARSLENLKINGSTFNTVGQSYGNIVALPIWLKSGDVVQYQNLGSPLNYFISILEFNLTQ
jgi:hypothetical protein